MLGDGTGTSKGPGAGASLVHPRHSKERGMEQRHRLGPGPYVWKILAIGGEGTTGNLPARTSPGPMGLLCKNRVF